MAALAICSVSLATTAVLSVRSSHRYWAELVGTIEQAQQVAGPGRPVVTTFGSDRKLRFWVVAYSAVTRSR